MLTISVKNFGPIAEGSVDLKPLTIFVGPSNTGKSYMATAVHAVVQAAGRGGYLPTDPDWFVRWGERRFKVFAKFGGGEEDYDFLKSYIEWARQQMGEKSDLSGMTVSDFPVNVRLWLRRNDP